METDKKDFNTLDEYLPAGRLATRQPYVKVCQVGGIPVGVAVIQLDGPSIEYPAVDIVRLRVRHSVMHSFWG
jgi:hypothetical protein